MSEGVEPSEILSKMDGLTLQEDGIAVKIKPPKRVLHFSDGVIEEYSTDDEKEDVVDNDDLNKVVDEVIFQMPFQFYIRKSVPECSESCVAILCFIEFPFFGSRAN